jgi:hypothetical protein
MFEDGAVQLTRTQPRPELALVVVGALGVAGVGVGWVTAGTTSGDTDFAGEAAAEGDAGWAAGATGWPGVADGVVVPVPVLAFAVPVPVFLPLVLPDRAGPVALAALVAGVVVAVVVELAPLVVLVSADGTGDVVPVVDCEEVACAVRAGLRNVTTTPATSRATTVTVAARIILERLAGRG